jgi:hypothetical protein
MTTRPAAALLSSVLAATLLPARARAEPLPLTLQWIAPPQCPSADEVRREVVRQVHVVPGRAPPSIEAEARVEAVGGRWRVELRTTRAGVQGHQILEDASCELLARATALVLALALYDAGDLAPPAGASPEPDGPRVEPAPKHRASSAAASPPPSPSDGAASPGPEGSEPAQPPPAAPPPAPEPTSSPTLAVAPAPSEPRARTWALAAEARVSRGPLPAPNFIFGAGVDARRGRWLARLRLAGGPASEQASRAAPDVIGRYQAWGAVFAGCLVARPGARLALAGCAELDASLLTGRAPGAPSAETAFAPWYAAGPAALAQVRVSLRARLEIGAGLGLSIYRARFALRHLADVYQVPRLVPGATLGLSIEL